ncbi:phospholipid:diacylglycerol acyltransferase 1 [Citrus sinensis]|nr:phospholipid:diacylglycerol acyltransferase 1 [Citrus sinensis]
MSLIRRRKPNETSRPTRSDPSSIDKEDDNKKKIPTKDQNAEEIALKKLRKWSCIDSCCWLIGSICVTWWFLLFLYNAIPASFNQYVTEAITGPVPDPPGVKLKKEGLTVKHPVVFVPGIVTGGLELWEGHQCAEGLFRKRLWGGTFGEVYKRPLCWVEHMSLDNETGLDPSGIRVRPVSGLVAADYFAPGYFVWAVLIANLARIGYEEKTMYMAAYDWRISFQNTEWVEAPAPMGGGGGPDWCAKHIKTVMNIGGPFFGVPKAVGGLFSAEAKDIAVIRATAPGFLDNDIFRLQTLQHVMRMTRTWDSTMSMIPKGGDTIWGGLDWSPEEGYTPSKRKQRNNDTQVANEDDSEVVASQRKHVNFGRIISFGKDIAEAPSSHIDMIDFRGAVKGNSVVNNTCRDVWTEYHEMGFEGIKAVAEYKAYTAESVLDLLHFVAPKLMARGSAHFSYGIADNLDDQKYRHYKYWSNPLETTLPNAPDMEIFSMYGVGIPTERAYVYKLTPSADCYIPFQIDTSADDDDTPLKDGVYAVDGDETVPVLSAGFMCAKGWRGKTRFNPSGIRTYLREYEHSPPANLLEGRGTQSGAHVDIMGNFQLIEDIIRVAAGARGEDLGALELQDKIDLVEMAFCPPDWRPDAGFCGVKRKLSCRSHQPDASVLCRGEDMRLL